VLSNSHNAKVPTDLRSMAVSKFQSVSLASFKDESRGKIQRRRVDIRIFHHPTAAPIVTTVSSAERTKYSHTPLEMIRCWPWTLLPLSGELNDNRFELKIVYMGDMALSVLTAVHQEGITFCL
jgi:hypothetical protein